MEIRKSPVSPQGLAALPRQREVSGAAAKPILRPGEDSAGQTRAPQSRVVFDAEGFRAALTVLEESRAAQEQLAQRDSPILNNRARLALAAYTAQQNVARDDDRSSLRQSLGVDYYA